MATEKPKPPLFPASPRPKTPDTPLRRANPSQTPRPTDTNRNQPRNPWTDTPPDESSRRGASFVRGKGSPVAGILQNVIGQMDSGAQVRASLALAHWPRVVGPQMAEATEPETVRNGILFLRTRSSSWSQEIELHKEHILLKLNRELGGRIITDIKYRSYGVDKQPIVETPEMPSPEELAAVVLEPFEKAQLRAGLQDLFTLQDERIRTTIARRMTQEAKLRHWRLEHGWRVCPRCDTVHKTNYRLCPLCRLCR